MKRSFALLLVTLLALFALTACGSNRNNAGAGSSSVTPDNGAGSAANGSGSIAPDNSIGDNGVLDNGATSYPNEDLNGNTSANNTPAGSAAGSANGTVGNNPITRGANDIVQGTENVVRDAGNAIGNAGTAVGNATGRMIRSATYDQMVTNGRVHDTDGFLYDYENAMTPGTRYF